MYIPVILRAFLVIYVLHASAQFGASLEFDKRHAKKNRAWKSVFCKAGLVWVSWEQCGTTIFSSLKNCFYAKPGFSEFHMSSVGKSFFRAWKVFLFAKPCFKRVARKKINIRAWKIVFLQSPASLSFIRAAQRKKSQIVKTWFFAAATHAKPSPLQPRQRERMRRQNSLKARFLLHNCQGARLQAWRLEVRIWAGQYFGIQ